MGPYKCVCRQSQSKCKRVEQESTTKLSRLQIQFIVVSKQPKVREIGVHTQRSESVSLLGIVKSSTLQTCPVTLSRMFSKIHLKDGVFERVRYLSENFFYKPIYKCKTRENHDFNTRGGKHLKKVDSSGTLRDPILQWQRLRPCTSGTCKNQVRPSGL